MAFGVLFRGVCLFLVIFGACIVSGGGWGKPCERLGKFLRPLAMPFGNRGHHNIGCRSQEEEEEVHGCHVIVHIDIVS